MEEFATDRTPLSEFSATCQVLFPEKWIMIFLRRKGGMPDVRFLTSKGTRLRTGGSKILPQSAGVICPGDKKRHHEE
jgi:hypothetical protein